MEEVTKKPGEQLETEISRAMRARVKDFKELADSLTLEGVRRALEKDLGTEVLSLDVHKRFIKQCLEECFCGGVDIDLSTTTGGSSGPCLPQMNEETSGVKDEPQEPKDPKSSSAYINENAQESPAGEGMPHNGLVKAEDLKRDMELNEDKIKKAIKKRGSYFRENQEKMTLVKVRRLLEEDLNLEKSTLDTYKRFISDVLDEVLQSSESADATNGIDKKPKKASQNKETGKVKREPKTSNDDSGSSNLDNDMIDSDADADEVKRPKKRTLQQSKSSLKSVKRQKISLKESRPLSSRKKKQEEPDIENRSESDAEKTSENDRSPSLSEETPKVKKSKSSMKFVKLQKKSLKESFPSSSRKKRQEEPDIENRSESDAEKSSENDRSPSSSEETPKKKQEKSTAQSYGKHVEHLKTVYKACGMGFFTAMEDDIVPDIPMQAEIPPHHGGGGPELAVIDSAGVLTRRRGKAICKDIRDLLPGTRAIIEVNDAGQPCNVPASTLLTSYLGVLAKDCFMAPISFTDWRSPGLDMYKRKMMTEIKAKFSFPPLTQTWIRQALGNKWRAYKTSLKAKYWDPTKPLEEIIARVPDEIEAVQWATLVTHWNEPREKERSTQNTVNAKKLTCPHTGGRKSLVRRQQETKTKDRLLLWRINRLHKDGSWVSEEAKQKWELACAILAAKQLTPEDGDAEENENVFRDVMGPEHPGRVRCKGFGVTPSKYYYEDSTSSTAASYMSTSSAERFTNLEIEVSTMKSNMSDMQKTMGKIYSLMKKKLSKKKCKN